MFRQLLDTRPTVVVIAGQQLGLLVVPPAHSTRDLLLQFFQITGTWRFCHWAAREHQPTTRTSLASHPYFPRGAHARGKSILTRSIKACSNSQ